MNQGTETENWQNYEDWREFIATHPDPVYSHTKTHWHMATGKDEIGGWDKCVADAYDEDEDDYVLVGGNCPDGTSTEVITPRPPPETNAAPRFTTLATKSVPENTTSVPTVTAVDDDSQDSVTGYDIVGGADQGQFSIVRSTGDLTFKTAPDYEAKNRYVVTVRATSGTGARKEYGYQTIIVTVMDVEEKPGTPNAPSVSAVSETSLRVSWSAPENKGPADHRLRLPISNDFATGKLDV